MDRDTLRARICSRIDELPTLPVVVPRVLRLMDDEMTGASTVADVVSRDPALTAKILKVANSAYYGFAQRIGSLDQAVPLLGFRMVRSLALSIGVIHALPSAHASGRDAQAGIWIHSLAVATAMERIGTRLRTSGRRDHPFVLGLLHDVGRIVLSEYFPDLFEQTARLAADSPETGLAQAERAVIGVDHGEVGAMLLGRWRFPDSIRNVIEVHHHGDTSGAVDPMDLALLRVADAVTQQLGMGEGPAAGAPEIRTGDRETLALGNADLDDVQSHLNGARQGIEDFFRRLE
jgi:putative nucleotidyltransferase with HDIG domain